MTSPSRSGVRHDDGFTLVEVLVTMAVATIVLLGILGASDIFRSTSDAASRLTAAQDAQRTALRQITDALRQSRSPAGETSPLTHTNTAVKNDLVAAVYVSDPTDALRPGWIRWCVSPDGRSLLVGSRIADTYAAAGAPGPCGTTAVTDPAVGWTYGKIIDGTLVDGGSLFTFSSDACFGATGVCPPAPRTVRTVGIRLAVGTASTTDPNKTTVLTGAVSLRNRTATP